jgi:hypothetical protein
VVVTTFVIILTDIAILAESTNSHFITLSSIFRIIVKLEVLLRVRSWSTTARGSQLFKSKRLCVVSCGIVIVLYCSRYSSEISKDAYYLVFKELHGAFEFVFNYPSALYLTHRVFVVTLFLLQLPLPVLLTNDFSTHCEVGCLMFVSGVIYLLLS